MLPYDLGIYVTGHSKLESMCFECYLRPLCLKPVFQLPLVILVKWAYIVNRNKMLINCVCVCVCVCVLPVRSLVWLVTQTQYLVGYLFIVSSMCTQFFLTLCVFSS